MDAVLLWTPRQKGYLVAFITASDLGHLSVTVVLPPHEGEQHVRNLAQSNSANQFWAPL
jgi:hypothetical protein